MAYMSDIEIAQSVTMQPITAIAQTAGIPDDYLEPYGNYKAKIDLAVFKQMKMLSLTHKAVC